MRKVVVFFGALWQKPIARIITSSVILAFLLLKLPLDELWETLQKVSPEVWLLVVTAAIAGHLVAALKWRMLTSGGGDRIPLLNTFRYHFAGLFANLFLPSIAGGDIVRAGMAIHHHSDKEHVILGSLLDRLFEIGALALFVLASGLLCPTAVAAEVHSYLTIVLLLLSGAALGIMVLLILPIPERAPRRLKDVISRLRGAIRHLVKRPWRAVAGLGLALLVQGLLVALGAFLGDKIGIHLAWPVWFVVLPLAKLAASLPISLGGLGVREVTLALVLGRFGVPATAAVGLGLLWQTVVIAVGALGGVFAFLSGQAIPGEKGTAPRGTSRE